jgi:predicted TPR repeat methyltransferase
MSPGHEAEASFQRALERFNAGDLDAAAAGFARAVQLDPAHALAHYQLGNVRWDQRRAEEAEAHFHAALALTPDHAESHNNLGILQQMSQRTDEAILSYARAAELKPTLTLPYLNLGRLLAARGRNAEAAGWYRRAIASTEHAAAFAHLLAALEGASPAAAPAEYLRLTFDGFAKHFDEHLVGALGYRVPDAVASALARVRMSRPKSLDVLDLGCGTGLSGLAVAPVARRLVGVDLSPGMLAESRARGCYHELFEADIVAWAQAAAPAQFDLVVAADVFIYLGALEALFAAIARLARPRALFAFSLEAGEGRDWRLQESGRYAHSAAYVERLARDNRFAVASRTDQPIRKPVVGLLYVLEASPGG